MLRNVIIGEGDAEAPTRTTLILVGLKGPINAAAPGSLEVTATAAGEELLKKTLLLKTFYSRTSQAIIPFIVYGTGCEPLEISARLIGTPGGTSTMTRVLPFRCAE